MAFAILLLLAALPQQDPDSDKLKKFEKTLEKSDLKQDDKPKTAKPSKPKSQDWDDDDDSDFLDSIGEAFFRVVFEFLALPFKYAFSDQGMRFDDYPYAHGRKYFQTGNRTEKLAAFDSSLTLGRIEHDIWSLGLGGTIRWTSGCDFHFDITQIVEDVDGGTDRLTLQQYQLNFGGHGKPRSFQVSFGLGLAVLQGEEVSDVGPSIQASLIQFPREPFSLRISAAIMGFSSATLTDLRAEVGVHWDRFAVTAGVRSLLSSGGEDLTGPTIGFVVFF